MIRVLSDSPSDVLKLGMLFFFLLVLVFQVLEQRQKMGEGERFQLGTVGALTLSVVSSVSIVICNKALMSSLHFIFGNSTSPFEL